MDAEVGYRLRTAGPPDEWHGDLTVGFKFTPRLMLMLQDFTTVSSPSTNPTFPAWRQSVVEASVVYALDDKWSVQLGLFSTVWTVKTNTAARRGACRVAEVLRTVPRQVRLTRIGRSVSPVTVKFLKVRDKRGSRRFERGGYRYKINF